MSGCQLWESEGQIQVPPIPKCLLSTAAAPSTMNGRDKDGPVGDGLHHYVALFERPFVKNLSGDKSNGGNLQRYIVF